MVREVVLKKEVLEITEEIINIFKNNDYYDREELKNFFNSSWEQPCYMYEYNEIYFEKEYYKIGDCILKDYSKNKFKKIEKDCFIYLKEKNEN